MSIKPARANFHRQCKIKSFCDTSRFRHATHLVRGLGGSHDAKEITKLLRLAGHLGKTESKKAKTDESFDE